MKQYMADAFSDKVFHGNLTAVCVLEQSVLLKAGLD